MDCEFRNRVCIRCKYKLPKSFPDNPHRTCDGPECKHLGDIIIKQGVKVTVKCHCGTSHVNYPVHYCSIFKRCIPALVPNSKTEWEERKPESDLYHLCHGCTKYA